MHNGQPPFTTNPILLKNCWRRWNKEYYSSRTSNVDGCGNDDRIKGLIASISKGFRTAP